MATLFASVFGSAFGILAAVKGGWVDALLSRIDDALMSIPGILAGLVAIAALGPSISVLILVTGLVKATIVYRLARALGMDIRGMDYIEVARARGENLWWVLRHEIFPNVAIPLIVDFGIRLSFAIRFIASLSFLGLGVQPPPCGLGQHGSRKYRGFKRHVHGAYFSRVDHCNVNHRPEQDTNSKTYQSRGILMYVEDLKPGSNKDIGPKAFFEMACSRAK